MSRVTAKAPVSQCVVCKDREMSCLLCALCVYIRDRRRKKRKSKRAGRYCESADDYYYVPTNNALTPRLRRKFPEGVCFLPNVPSDLEESAKGTYRGLAVDPPIPVTPESVVEHAFSFIDEEADDGVESAPTPSRRASDRRLARPDAGGRGCNGDEGPPTPQGDDWSVDSEELEDLLTQGVHHGPDYDESSLIFDHRDGEEVPRWVRDDRRSGCGSGTWRLIDSSLITSDKDAEELENRLGSILGALRGGHDASSAGDANNTLLVAATEPVIVEEVCKSESLTGEITSNRGIKPTNDLQENENFDVHEKYNINNLSTDEEKNIPTIFYDENYNIESDLKAEPVKDNREYVRIEKALMLSSGNTKIVSKNVPVEDGKIEQQTQTEGDYSDSDSSDDNDYSRLSGERSSTDDDEDSSTGIFNSTGSEDDSLTGRQNATDEDEWVLEENPYTLLPSHGGDTLPELVEYDELRDEEEQKIPSAVSNGVIPTFTLTSEKWCLVRSDSSSASEMSGEDEARAKGRRRPRTSRNGPRRVNFDERVSILESTSSGSDEVFEARGTGDEWSSSKNKGCPRGANKAIIRDDQSPDGDFPRPPSGQPQAAVDLAQNSNVQDAFVIAVEQQARERLERLSALKRIKPVDMTKLSQQLNQQIPATEHQQELNGFIESSPIYVTSIPAEAKQQQQVAAPVARTKAAALSNGHVTSSAEEPDSTAEIELTQELTEARSASPFANGRTEVLIGQESADASRVRTTAIVENHRGLVVGDDAQVRTRRRSGSSIVVVDAQDDQEEPVKHRTPEEEDAYNAMMMMMSLDNGPHREMAVDVPDTFIARSKTPPRYPPPRIQGQPQPVNGSAAKPVPPPRDHLRIERDGRLVNRAPAPQVPARTAPANHVPAPGTPEQSREPTKEQLDSIRKFQEALRKRKEEEERAAQQAEFLNRSLRGSKKLQALESHPPPPPPPPPPSGIVNDGYSSEELELADEDHAAEKESLHQVISYGELVASLQRLQLQLKKTSVEPGLKGYTSLEGQVAAVQTLLLSREFGRALAVHNKVQEALVHQQGQAPVTTNVQGLVRECVDALQPCSLADAAELADLLTRYEVEGLLLAHDGIAVQHSAVQSPCSPSVPGTLGDDKSPAAEEKFPSDANIKIIKIEKTNEPLGATVRNEGDAVIIGRIVKGGAAEKSGLLHEGDEVLEVNGMEMRGKTINEVCDILSGMTGTLTFLIVPQMRSRPPPPPARETLMHVKAHFDYDPEDDLYIPCRELGISFQKGDVLHVISQEDPNWWQAYREGEEDQTLAGLIPSRTFQHQREAMKQTMTGDKTTKEKSKKTGMLLCAKKNPKKKKKKPTYGGSYNDGAYPLYATNTLDDYDVDEILTYEEVSLYYPRANHKRPIVLIGPPNIGRHELRQRLMEDSERFAAAIPHTSRPKKDGEVDGQDYHFISRVQFESDILARKFVEHGEYEKAYYGTSLDAIRSVVNSGKICVLNLHPQSLKILRNSDLKPYVVFVAPPSLEKLRQKKIRNGEAFKEDELKDIIEKAREMEDKYGHYFDMIIINNDTDRAFHQLVNEINSLEREPQWVPAHWVRPV